MEDPTRSTLWPHTLLYLLLHPTAMVEVEVSFGFGWPNWLAVQMIWSSTFIGQILGGHSTENGQWPRLFLPRSPCVINFFTTCMYLNTALDNLVKVYRQYVWAESNLTRHLYIWRDIWISAMFFSLVDHWQMLLDQQSRQLVNGFGVPTVLLVKFNFVQTRTIIDWKMSGYWTLSGALLNVFGHTDGVDVFLTHSRQEKGTYQLRTSWRMRVRRTVDPIGRHCPCTSTNLLLVSESHDLGRGTCNLVWQSHDFCVVVTWL